MSLESELPRTLTAEVKTYYPVGSLHIAQSQSAMRLQRENTRLAPRIVAVDQHHQCTPIVLPALMRRRIYTYVQKGYDQDAQRNCEDFAYAVNGVPLYSQFTQYPKDWNAYPLPEPKVRDSLPIGSTVLLSTEPWDSPKPHLVHWYIVAGNGYVLSKRGNFGGVEVAKQVFIQKQYPYQYQYVMQAKKDLTSLASEQVLSAQQQSRLH